jgi:hypothetical protein
MITVMQENPGSDVYQTLKVPKLKECWKDKIQSKSETRRPDVFPNTPRNIPSSLSRVFEDNLVIISLKTRQTTPD